MQELLFLHSARRLMLIDICMKFCEDSLRGFQVTEPTRFVTDRQTRQTDGQMDAGGKTTCLPTLKGGDINTVQTFYKISQLVSVPLQISPLFQHVHLHVGQLHFTLM